jgi:peptidoglycan/xylan/chitin deacetylase (PgdA/CDA1 family)
MSLTFDCGASAQPTPAILDALEAEGVRTTFFLTGQWVRQNPELSKRIAAEHEIANHSVTHPDFTRLTDGQIREEMEMAERIIRETTGAETRPLWRAPFGARDRRVLAVVADLGWAYHIYWTADSGDWRDITPQQVRANINAAAQNGAIIVEHCGSTQSAAVIRQVIMDLKAKGFRLTTVSDLLRD